MSNEATEAKRIDQPGLAPEEMPSLADFDESSGLLGWYGAVILEGYATKNGTQFTTGDTPGREGSRLLRFCFGVKAGSTQRNIQKTIFYNPDNFKPENLARIKDLREQFRGQKSWTGHGHDQHFSIELSKLAQLEKAVGFKLNRHPNGGFLTAPYIGQRLDVRISPDKKSGYDEVQGFAKAGTQVGKQ